ncbi:hypothetical protein [Acinetobacter sp. WCHA39]|uniref:hypothetical protein n=1 Tax=Acinetobacter sp. WCHA39 TaxID=2004648 RepID=UPI000B3C2701|nr:hypothetical protein [Acinetobacter sp. WCHA39]
MKNLNELKIVNTDFDLDTGFFWIEFENGKSLQCCLKLRKDLKGYKKEIVKNDNGSCEGLSGDNNDWALDEENPDWANINDLLHREARKLGIKIN